jgi:hypothetical protein
MGTLRKMQRWSMSLEGPTSRSVTDASSNNARNTGAQSVNLMTDACLPLRSGWHLASARVILGILGLGLDLLVARATTAPARLTSRQVHNTNGPPGYADSGAQERLDGVRMSEVRVWLACCPCAPALWSGELEEEDDGGECVIGEIESNGSSEKGKC